MLLLSLARLGGDAPAGVAAAPARAAPDPPSDDSSSGSSDIHMIDEDPSERARREGQRVLQLAAQAEAHSPDRRGTKRSSNAELQRDSKSPKSSPGEAAAAWETLEQSLSFSEKLFTTDSADNDDEEDGKDDEDDGKPYAK